MIKRNPFPAWKRVAETLNPAESDLRGERIALGAVRLWSRGFSRFVSLKAQLQWAFAGLSPMSPMCNAPGEWVSKIAQVCYNTI